MKKIIFSVTLCLFINLLHAQIHKIDIYCTLYPDGDAIYFKNQDKVLPDSVKSVMINPKKDYKMKNFNTAIIFMSANGWKMVSEVYTNTLIYVMKKEILLDEDAWKLYIEKIKVLETKTK